VSFHESVFFVTTSILDVRQFVKILWFMSLYYEISIVVLSLLFSAVTSAFQLFICKLCLQFSGLRMRNFTWNRFPIKNLLIDSLLTPMVESTYLNRDMCKFDSSQKDESRWQSTDSSKAYRNTSAFKWRERPVQLYSEVFGLEAEGQGFVVVFDFELTFSFLSV